MITEILLAIETKYKKIFQNISSKKIKPSLNKLVVVYLDVIIQCMHVPHLAVPVLVATNEKQQLPYLTSHNWGLLSHHVLTQIMRPGWFKLAPFP